MNCATFKNMMNEKDYNTCRKCGAVFTEDDAMDYDDLINNISAIMTHGKCCNCLGNEGV